MDFRLKAKIIERFGSQADFAQAIGEDESLVSRVVRGRRELSEDKKLKWSKILHIDEDLFPRRTTKNG